MFEFFRNERDVLKFKMRQEKWPKVVKIHQIIQVEDDLSEEEEEGADSRLKPAVFAQPHQKHI